MGCIVLAWQEDAVNFGRQETIYENKGLKFFLSLQLIELSMDWAKNLGDLREFQEIMAPEEVFKY